MRKSKLTPLHWCVYRFLLNSTQDGVTKLSQREIYQHCIDQGFKVTWNENQNQHNDHCRWLKRIVDECNFSLELDKLIYHHGYRYCIANEPEAQIMLAKYSQRIMLASKRRWVLAKKMYRNGQGKTVTNRCETMDGSKAQEFHSTYREEEQCQKNG